MMKINLTGIAAAMLGMALFLGACDKKNDNEQAPSTEAPPPAPAPSAPSESTTPPPAAPDQGATPAPEKPSDDNTKKTPAS
jgi:hypothetical protein